MNLTYSRFARFCWAALVYNIGVIVWGTLVRASLSGDGCGDHWPLCNGEVIPPAEQVKTIIEFTHRITSGGSLILAIVALVWGFRTYPKGHPVRIGVVAIMMGMLAESLAGAALVLFRWVHLDVSVGRLIMMPTHLVITFYLLASLALTAWWASGGLPLRPSTQPRTAMAFLAALFLTLLVGMAGAVTALGDTVLPVKTFGGKVEGQLSQVAQWIVDLRMYHPVMAVAVCVYVFLLANMLRRSRHDAHITFLSSAVMWLFIVQLAAGMLNIVLLVPVWMQLLHLFIADLLWISLVLLTAAGLGGEKRA